MKRKPENVDDCPRSSSSLYIACLVSGADGGGVARGVVHSEWPESPLFSQNNLKRTSHLFALDVGAGTVGIKPSAHLFRVHTNRAYLNIGQPGNLC